MQTSALSDRFSAALLDFVWDEWAQMGVLATARRRSRWAQDPEALLLLTFELARDDARLFDEVLDWLLRNERIVSTRRLRTLCEGSNDKRLVDAALGWVASYGRSAHRGARPPDGHSDELLFRESFRPRDADPEFLAHGLLKPRSEPSRKSRPPDRTAPINLAFRLRDMLGVGARAEAVRFLLTVDAPRASVAAVTASAGYAKRNVQEALTSLHDAGVVLVTIGTEQRYGIDRSRWAHLLQVDVDELPVHREWPQLLGALRRILRWLRRPDLDGLTEYLRASQARDLLDDVRPALTYAGVVTPAWRSVDHTWEDLVDMVDHTLLALGVRSQSAGRSATFEVYRDASGGHRWRLSAPTGRVVAASPASYASYANARAAAERLRSNPEGYVFATDRDGAGNYRWRASAANGRSVAASADSFASQETAERAARAARELASAAAAAHAIIGR